MNEHQDSIEKARFASTDGRAELFEVENVEKRYQLGQLSVQALKDVSLKVNIGEALCIMGASGAGKSTLLHILGGLDRPSDGRVWFKGRDLYGMSSQKRCDVRAEKIGFIFQAYHLLPELDILENVMLPSMSRWGYMTSSQTCRSRARRLLDQVGLGERVMHRPRELSGGERQRAALARALMNEPEVVLADEPTGNLDSKTGEQVLQYLFTLTRDRGHSLIIVTHNETIAGLCDRKIILKDGRLTE